MRVKIFGIKFTVSYFFCAALCIMILCDRTGLFIPMILAVLIHECGHLVLMWIFDCAPTEIKLIPGSVQICAPVCDTKPTVMISLAGPLANLVVFSVVFISCAVFKDGYYLPFALVNLVYGVFNLLPFAGLDGGSAFEEFLIRKKSVSFARKAIGTITVCASVFALSVAVFLSAAGRNNYSVYILALYLVLAVLLKF